MVKTLIPKMVEFTELSLDPSALTNSRIEYGIIPLEWIRIRFETKGHILSKLNRWLEKNIEGRWANYIIFKTGKYIVVQAFEDDADAVMFKLKNGETSWDEKEHSN